MAEAIPAARATSGPIVQESIWNSRVFTGEWQHTKAGSIVVREPATGAELTSVGLAGATDIAQAAARAAIVQREWVALAPTERARVFYAAARLLEDQASDIVPWIMRETGAVAPKAQFEI